MFFAPQPTYLDQNAFTHHALHALDAPAQVGPDPKKFCKFSTSVIDSSSTSTAVSEFYPKLKPKLFKMPYLNPSNLMLSHFSSTEHTHSLYRLQLSHWVSVSSFFLWDLVSIIAAHALSPF